ncbi:MAG: DUF86 domain-containing protein [Planctomycetes bacterium]|nr:DUF86 domain-containing protein [Planctomycetota bacterium]
MQPEDRARIHHILDAAEAVLRWIEHKSGKEFANDDLLIAATSYEIQIIGEAARNLSEEFTNGNPQLPWHKIIGMRHRIVHDYYVVDAQILWTVATTHIPPLVDELRKAVPRRGAKDKKVNRKKR